VNDQTCEFPLTNAGAEEIADIVSTARTIAVVGLSDKTDRDSYHIAAYMQRHGYRIIPVNPVVTEVLGEKAYPDLAAIPPDIAVDIVDIFRKPDAIPAIVEQAVARGAGTVWMQQGLAHNAAADRARAAGLRVVMDRCLMVEHARLPATR